MTFDKIMINTLVIAGKGQKQKNSKINLQN